MQENDFLSQVQCEEYYDGLTEDDYRVLQEMMQDTDN